MKYPVDIEKYKEDLEILRRDLEKTLKTGILDENFNEKLLELESCKDKIIKELLPYYRTYGKELYPTKLEDKKINLSGFYKIDSSIKNFLPVNDNIFLLGTLDGQVYFSRFLEDKATSIELSQPIKNFSKFITYTQKINQRQILALTVNGEILIISSNDFADVFENIKSIKVKSLEKKLPAIENVLGLDEKTLLCQIGPKDFVIIAFDFEKETYKLLGEVKDLNSGAEISSLAKTSNKDLVFGTSRGDLIFGKYRDNKIYLEERIKLSEAPIKQIEILEDEKLLNKNLGVVDAKGALYFFNINNKEIQRLGQTELEGRLFNLSSCQGTAMVLSEDGHAYLFEENLENWTLNTGVSLREKYFKNLWPLNPSAYLAVNIYGDLSLLKIDRLNSIRQLEALSIFK